jgi:hypothetical protein
MGGMGPGTAPVGGMGRRPRLVAISMARPCAMAVGGPMPARRMGLLISMVPGSMVGTSVGLSPVPAMGSVSGVAAPMAVAGRVMAAHRPAVAMVGAGMMDPLRPVMGVVPARRMVAMGDPGCAVLRNIASAGRGGALAPLLVPPVQPAPQFLQALLRAPTIVVIVILVLFIVLGCEHHAAYSQAIRGPEIPAQHQQRAERAKHGYLSEFHNNYSESQGKRSLLPPAFKARDLSIPTQYSPAAAERGPEGSTIAPFLQIACGAETGKASRGGGCRRHWRPKSPIRGKRCRYS